MSFEPSDFRSYIKKMRESIQSFVKFLHEKHILKNARITYKVIWNLFLIFVVLGLMGAFFAFGAGAGYFASLVKNEPIMSYAQMKKNIANYSQTSEIYFAHNVRLGKMPSDLQREPVKLDQVSDNVKKAIIATEDKYFYQHHGVVPKAVIRSLFEELTNAPTVTGGSTVTQQLVKNQILTPEVSFKRKAKEMLYAMRIERFFSKSQILEGYLNVVSFGRNASGENIAGIQAASQGVFGVDADKLNIPQAAYLAGMPKNPFSYTPYENSGGTKKDISAGLNRMKTVLKRMRTSGFISEEQYENALHYNVAKHLAKPKKSTFERYPYLTREVQRRASKIIAEQIAQKQGYNGKQLAEHANVYDNILYEKKTGVLPGHSMESSAKYKGYKFSQLENDAKLFHRFKQIAEKQISRNGYKIYTTIDKKIYDTMQEATHNFNNYELPKVKLVKDRKTGKVKKRKYLQQTAGMLIKNDTGAIISFVGGRGFDHLKYNLATQATRQSGSTIKPLLDYAPAMEKGIVQPGSIIADLPVTLNGWPPHNYADYGYGRYHGLVTTRKALEQSYNVPAAKTYYKLTHVVSDPTKYLRKMGINTLLGTDNTNLTMSIGSQTKGVTVEELTNAYSTFGNGGKFTDAYMIDKIVSSDGKVVYQHKVKPVKIFSRQTNYLTVDMMRNVLSGGTGTTARRDLNFQADWAGKTGTSESVKDSWFIATNPNVTLGVWIGFANGAPLIASSHSQRNQQIWASLANAAYKVDPKLMDPDERFHMPTGIVRRSVCEISGMLPSKACEQAGLVTSDLFNQKYAPNRTDDALIGGGHYFSVRPGFIEKHFLGVKTSDFYANLPADWKNIVPPNKLGKKEEQAKQKKTKKEQKAKDQAKRENKKHPSGETNNKKNNKKTIGDAAKTTNDKKSGQSSGKTSSDGKKNDKQHSP